MNRLAMAALIGMGIASAVHAQEIVVRPEARLQTEPVPHSGDAADDPAIWIHPTDPAKSLILGTDKQGGLIVYGMDGQQRQLAADGCRPNNVDVLYGFRLGDRSVDLAVASCRGKPRGAKVWRIDPDRLSLEDVSADGILPALEKDEPYGISGYRSTKTGQHFFFITGKGGRVEQHRLEAAGGKIRSRIVRTLKIPSQPEGVVADDELGHLYIGEEAKGIWKYGAEPDDGRAGQLIARVGEHGLKDDVEGLAIYYAKDGKGYLIVSSQGNNTFIVYTRAGDNRYVLTIDPKDAAIDDVDDTDGIAVTNRPTAPLFPRGFLIVQDGSNRKGNQNFKLYGWEDIAADRLLIDPSWPVRSAGQ